MPDIYKDTLNEPIQHMINHSINEIPKPMKVTITEVYEDDLHVDAETENEDIFEYVLAIGSNIDVDNIGVLLFLDDDSMIIIT